MDPETQNQNPTSSTDSLEAPGTVVEPTSSLTESESLEAATDKGALTTDVPSDTPNSPLSPKTPRLGSIVRLRELLHRFNIYLLLFILVLVIAGVGVTLAYVMSTDDEGATGTLTTQELTQETLDQVRNSDTTVGDPKQTLSIESNAIFSGKVLVRDSLDVAGTITVGGALSLPGITVSGASSFDQVQINNLAIAGDTTVQGQLSIQRNLSVSGNATVSGTLTATQLSIDSLQLNKDLQLNRHIDPGGSTPRISNGAALGGGGTVSISGTDTAGTITINPGSGAGGGSVAVVTFAAAFSGTPHVVITPVGKSVDYYTTRTTTGFTIFVTSTGLSGSFSFDYIAID